MFLSKFNLKVPSACKCVSANSVAVKVRRYGMIANETTLHKRPNDTEIYNYMSPYGLQQ